MSNGTVKWFNLTKGFGFITPDSGGKDAFVHITEVERAGMAPLVEGQRIQYEEVNDTRGLKAVSLVAAE
ncbi:cold-shock protein [Alphaproteobacteria bacterium]|jgi:cold shock protein|nr:cold-shock protein [Alphaproteobacteria bacterium]|tara:strand:- start:111 stop:317 length:207 start_codon:yes stop_codon:yes gene_type:complete